jgi:hypothetical protein
MTRFGFLWAFAVLYHQVFYRAATGSPLDLALTLAAVAALLWPGSVAILGTLAACHVLVTVQHLPAVYNHAYFSSLVSLALGLAAIVAWWQSRRPGRLPVADGLSAAFAPAGRVCLLTLYFLSGFHKLNHDFLIPGVSCGTVMFESLWGRLGLMGSMGSGSWLGVVAIGITLSVELGGPVLLAIGRTRTAGVAVALLFHVAMAAAGYPRFSAAAVALLTLFLPVETSTFTIAMRTRLLVATTLLLGALAGPRIANPVFLTVQLLLTGLVLVQALRGGSRNATASAQLPPSGSTLRWAPMLAPVLLLLSGATPYLGLGTDRALSMYSNLRTEGGHTNHLLVPEGAQVFSYQRDLVVILQSSVPRLQRDADRKMVLPYQELRAILTDEIAGGRVGGSVVFLRDGERHESGDAARDFTLGVPVSWFARKFLRFRPVEAAGPRACGV